VDDAERDRAAHRLERLAGLAADLRAAENAVIRARYAAEVQRLSGWVLRDAIKQSREEGFSWRDIARRTGMPFDTLYRQLQDHGRIAVGKPGDDEPA
jgi:type II secretory pathway component PulM